MLVIHFILNRNVERISKIHIDICLGLRKGFLNIKQFSTASGLEAGILLKDYILLTLVIKPNVFYCNTHMQLYEAQILLWLHCYTYL